MSFDIQSKTILPVVFLTDDNYVIPTSVAIQSLIEASNKTTKLDLYIFEKDVSEENKKLFDEYNSDMVSVNHVDTDTIKLGNYDEKGYYVASTALLKFSIPDLLKQYDKVLYIDGDILVKKDLSDFFNTNIENYYVAAVPDMAAIDACHYDEHLKIIDYFNSGVLLLNAKKIRDLKLSNQLYKTKDEHPEYRCMDQDVFNDVFYEHVLFMPPKYNLMFYNFQIANFTLERVNEFYNTNYKSFEEMQDDSYIEHLTNEKKPWKYKDAYRAELWADYFERTPFAKAGIKIKYVDDYDNENGYAKAKKGIFTKISTIPCTTLYLGKIPVVKKIRNGANIIFKLMGIPVARKISNGFLIKYYCLNICYKKIYDAKYFEHRLNTYKDIIKMQIDQFGGFSSYTLTLNNEWTPEEQIALFRQFDRIGEMKRTQKIFSKKGIK